MAEGSVRWFNSERGYGFITPDGGGPDVHVHYSEIQTNGYKTLEEGERVSFAVAHGAKGLTAVKVTPLGERWPQQGMDRPSTPPPRARRRAAGVLAVLVLACLVAFVVLVVRGSEWAALFIVAGAGLGYLASKLDVT